MSRRADVTVTDGRGYTALHYACASDVDSNVKATALIQRGATSQTATAGSKQFYTTALRLAVGLNQADRVRALIDDHIASINAPDQNYRTALHLAALAGHAEVVEVLVQHPDCRVNATDDRGGTALQLAAEAGHGEAVEVSLSHPSCDVSITDEDGRTAADAARDEGHDDIAALIEAKARGKSTIHL